MRREWRARAVSAVVLALLSGCTFFRGPLRAPGTVSVQCANALVVGLAWEPAATGARPSGYRVERDGALLAISAESSFVDDSVAGSHAYRYDVSAVDRSGTVVAAPSIEVSTPPAAAGGDAPYCPSRTVAGMAWDWSQGYRAAEGSDLWPVTWGLDGNIYAFFGDGGGFGGDDYRGRASFGIARITGAPPPTPANESNVYGGFETTHPATFSGKARALIAIGADFYAVGGLYGPGDARFERTPPISGAPDHLELLYSLGNAHSWQRTPWVFCQSESQPDAVFCPSGFVNAGPGYRGTGTRYVYLFGSSPLADHRDPDAASSGRTFLARVKRGKLRTQNAYEYFDGEDGHGVPRWSRDAGLMRAVFIDRNAPVAGCSTTCSRSSSLEEAVYDPGLKRFIGVAQGDTLAQTSFYDAPHPWGPWTTMSYQNLDADGAGGWGSLGAAAGGSLGVHPITAWTTAEGTELWMTYSSDGKADATAAFPPAGTKLDGFHLVRVRLQVKSLNN